MGDLSRAELTSDRGTTVLPAAMAGGRDPAGPGRIPVAKVVQALLVPPGGIALGLLAGLLLLYFGAGWGIALIALTALALWLTSLPVVADRVTRSAGSPPPLDLAAAQGRADVVVVIGRGYRPHAPEFGGEPWLDAMGLERLLFAAHLHRSTGAPILVSGGDPYGRGASEGELMRRFLAEALQITASHVEARAQNTHENARFSWEILSAHGIRRIYLVTHAAEMARAAEAFAAEGFEVVPAPMGAYGLRRRGRMNFLPDIDALRQVSILSYECLGVLYYAMRGWF